ncbi:LacI family DNA-binding transcriptional regulator [Micrococcales bacterium 31B]|nr:LacI family DNA-binding transcriptional regulator [Micrococcales bacterium 31B]
MQSEPSAPRVRMADVARRAGVSAQTVSRYFSGASYVGEETRERIARVVDELGYRPNLVARNLRTQRSGILGVLALSEMNFGGSGVLAGMSRGAREAGYALSVMHLDSAEHGDDWRQEVRRAHEFFEDSGVDGLVVTSITPGDDALIAQLGVRVPLVLAAGVLGAKWPSVSCDSRAAGRLATEHLIGLGHDRVLHLEGPANTNEARARREGYEQAMRAAGLEPLCLPGAGSWEPQAGRDACARAAGLDFTGVFAANDEIALGFMGAQSARGLVAPRDYSIVGVDDMPLAEHLWPSLTTVRLDFREVGRVAVLEVVRHLETGRAGGGVVLQPELVVRDSTAPYSSPG